MFLEMNKACDNTKNLVLLLQIIHNSATEFGELFHLFCGRGNYRMVKFFLESSQHSTVEVIVNKQDSKGLNPLFHAACTGHLEIVKLLFEHGANLMHSSCLSPIVGALVYLALVPYHVEEYRLWWGSSVKFCGDYNNCKKSFKLDKFLAEHSSSDDLKSSKLLPEPFNGNKCSHWSYVGDYVDGIRRKHLEYLNSLLPRHAFSRLCDDLDGSAELIDLLLPSEPEDLYKHLTMFPAEFQPMHSLLLLIAAVRETSTIQSLLSSINMNQTPYQFNATITDSDSSENSKVFSTALELAPVSVRNRASELFESFLLRFIPSGGICPSQMVVAANKGYWSVVEALTSSIKAPPGRHTMRSLVVTSFLEICYLAVRANKIELVSALLQVAQSTQLLTPQWWPQLMSATVHTDCPYMVRCFMSAGCDIYTCVKAAVKWGRIKTIDLLLDSVATIKEHFTELLTIAAQANQHLVVQRLFQFYQANVEIEIDLNFSRNTSFWLLVLLHSVRNGHQSLALEAVGYISERDISTIASQQQTTYHDILYYSCYWGLAEILPCIPYSPSTLMIRQTHDSPLEAAIANGKLGSVYNTPSNFPLGDDISAWLKEGPLVSAAPQSKYCKCTCLNTRPSESSIASDYLLHVTLLNGLFHQMLSMGALHFYPKFTDATPCNTVLCRKNAVSAFVKLIDSLSGPILVFALKECLLDLLNGAVIMGVSILLEQILRVLLSSECLSEYCAFSEVSYVHKAVELGHTACLKLLLRSGDVFVNQLSAINSNGDNILHCAAIGRGQSVETLTVILEWLAKSAYEMCFALNKYGDSPISLAFQVGTYERASKLLTVAQWSKHWQENCSVVMEWQTKAMEWQTKAMETRGWLCALMNYVSKQTRSANDLKVHHLQFNIRSIKHKSKLFKEAIHFCNSDMVSAMLISSCGLILTDKNMLRIGLLDSSVITFLCSCPYYVHVNALDVTDTVCRSITRRDCSNEVIVLITLVNQKKVPISLDLEKIFIAACAFSRLTLVQHFLSNKVSLSTEVIQKGIAEALNSGSCEGAAAILLSYESINSDLTSWKSNVLKLIFVRENTLDYQTIVEDLFGSLARPENICRLSFSEEWLVHKWGQYQKILFEKMASLSRTPPNPWMLGVKWRDIAHTVEITVDWESFATCLLEPPLTEKQQNTPLLVEAIVFSSSVLGQLCLTEDNENHVYNLADFFNCPEPLNCVVISAVQWPHTPSACLTSPSEGLLSLSYKQHDRVFVFPPLVVEGTDRGWDESYSTDSGMHSLYMTDTSIDNTHNTSTNEPLDLWNFYQKKLKKIHQTSISIAIEAGLMNPSIIMSLIDWCSEAIQLSSLPTTTYANIQGSDRMWRLLASPPKKPFSDISINIDSAREGETSSSIVSLVDGGLDFSIALATNTSHITMPSFDSLLQQTVNSILIREVEILQRKLKRLITKRLIPCFQHVLRYSIDTDSVTILFEDLNGTFTELSRATVSHIHLLKAFHKIRKFCDNFCDILNAYSHKPKLLANISTSIRREFKLVISEVSSTNITIDTSLPSCLTIFNDDLNHPQRYNALLTVTASLLRFTQEAKHVTGVKTWLNDIPCPFLTHVDLKRGQKFLYPTVGVPSNLIIQLVSYGGDKLNLPLKYKCCLEVKICSGSRKAIRASSSEEPSSSSASTKLFVTVSTDGQFEVIWNPSEEGLHSITVTLNRVEIQESFKRVFVEKALTNNSGKRQICAGSHLTFIAAHVGCKCPFSSQNSKVILTRDTVIEPSPILKNVQGYKSFIRPFKHTRSSLSSPSITSSSDRPPERLRAAVSAGGGMPVDSTSDPVLPSLPLLHHISITAAHGSSKRWLHTASLSVTVHTASIQEESKTVRKQSKKRSTKLCRVKRLNPKKQSRHSCPMFTQGSCTSVSLGHGMYRVTLQCKVAGSYKVFASCPLCQSVMKIYWLDKQSFYPQLYYVVPGPFSTKTSTIHDMNIGALLTPNTVLE